MYENLKIAERLDKSYRLVTMLTGLAALLGVIVMIILSVRYSSALVNYGFSQGDIGKALVTLADARSATRAVIGYTEEEAVNSAMTEHTEKKEAFETYFAIVENTLTTADERTMYDNMQKAMEAYWTLDAEIIAMGNTTDVEQSRQAQIKAYKELAPAYESVYSELAALMDLNVNQGNRISSILTSLSIVLTIVVIVIIAGASVFAIKLGKNMAKGIVVPLSQLNQRFKTFAAGDLSSPFPTVDSKDEIAEMIGEAKEMAGTLNMIIKDAGEMLGQMAEGNYAVKSSVGDKYTGDFAKLRDSMRSMRDQMIGTLQSIEEAASQVSAGAENLADASQNLAEGATEQAGAIEELQATITTIAESIQQSANNAEESYKQAKGYADEAGRSRVEMQTMVSAMERINETSKKIENIISEIEDIASQTNLLSLNASIEAARAGEAGRGFSVVADQIRQLAEQSTKSAVDTRELIEGALKEVEEGNKAAGRAAHSIGIVVTGIENIADAAMAVSRVSVDQAESMSQAEKGVTQISEVVQSNSATAQESSATSEELSAQAITLNELIGQFVLQ